MSILVLCESGGTVAALDDPIEPDDLREIMSANRGAVGRP
jgi:hypothetical protein